MRSEGTGSAENAAPVYQFGAFEFNVRNGELRKHGLRLKLQDQPVRILALLLENAGEVVGRDQIRARLWPSDIHVDYDNAINSALRKLRDSLSDTAENPRLIETVARRGYRFVAPVSPKLPAAPFAEPVPAKARNWWRLLAIPVTVVGIVAGLAIWGAKRDPRTTELTAPVPFTSYPGIECCPSFSPDGTRVAFSWNGPKQDNFDIYVKLVGSGEPLRLTQNPALDKFPAWSPDGRSIAFLRQADERHGVVVVMPSLPGQERELTRTEIGWTDLDYRTQGPALAWSADGRYLFTVETRDPSGTLAIVRISADSGEKVQITAPPPGIAGDGAPSVSPDGRTLAFTRTVTGLVNGDIYLVPLTDGAARKEERITFDAKCILGHAWSADGRDLVFSSDRGGRVQLWRLDVFGSRKPVRLAGAGEENGPIRSLLQMYLAVSRQGERLVYTQPAITGPEIRRVDIAGGRGGAPARLTLSTLGEHSARYSPDGTRIALHSNRSGRGEIWVCNVDGSEPVKLTSFQSGYSSSPAWSPDGRSIAFDNSSSGNRDIYMVRLADAKPVRLTTDATTHAVPTWSRDGKWIYFASNRSGRFEVWKIRIAGGPPMQVTHNGGFEAIESEDGRELYYTRAEGAGGLWRMPVEGGAEQKVVESVFISNIDVAKHGIYFMQQSDADIQLRFLDPTTGKLTTVSRLGRFVNLGLTVSPDERSALYSQEDVVGSNLMLVEHFR